MKKLWNKFTAWLSGWPEGTSITTEILKRFFDRKHWIGSKGK